MNGLTSLWLFLNNPDAVYRFLEKLRDLGVPTTGA